MLFWGSIRTTLKFLISTFDRIAENDDSWSKAISALAVLLDEAKAHVGPEPSEELLGNLQVNHPSPSKNNLTDILVLAESYFSTSVDAVVKQVRQGWIDFVRKELASKSSSLFKYISKQDKQFLNVNFAAAGGADRNPTKFLAEQSANWAGFWAPLHQDVGMAEQEHTHIHVLLAGLRAHAMSMPPDPHITPAKFNQSLKGYHKDTRGSDNWTSTELKALPDFSKSSISDALQLAHHTVVQPHQHLVNLNSCLGKPGNGIRTVCKTPMLYRVSCRLDQSIRDWESNTLQAYDSAKKSSSAALSALSRNFAAEVAMWTGKVSSGVFNDFHIFFDSVDLPTQVNFPARELATTLQQHLAPRVIPVL